MYETVKVVNGYEIKRMKGTHGFYHVDISKRKSKTFHTIKAAVKFIETVLS